jgi:hypothetical protein
VTIIAQIGSERFAIHIQIKDLPTKATVNAWRVSLEERRLGSSSIIIRMSAIRKLAAEAADNGLLAPELAQGIRRVKSVKSTGSRVGNWMSQRQALLSPPDIATVGGLQIAQFSRFFSAAASDGRRWRHSPPRMSGSATGA